jgi:hypothetical protein
MALGARIYICYQPGCEDKISEFEWQQTGYEGTPQCAFHNKPLYLHDPADHEEKPCAKCGAFITRGETWTGGVCYFCFKPEK